jgi:hypothetical protein
MGCGAETKDLILKDKKKAVLENVKNLRIWE